MQEPPKGIFAELRHVQGELGAHRLPVARPARQAGIALNRANAQDAPLPRPRFEHPAVEHEAIARLEPFGVGRLHRSQIHTRRSHRDRFLRGNRPDVAPQPAAHAPVPDDEPAPAPHDSWTAPAHANRRIRFLRPRRTIELAGEEPQTVVEIGTLERGERTSSAKQLERLVFAPLGGAGHAEHLLTEDVERVVDGAHGLDRFPQRGVGREGCTHDLGRRGGQQQSLARGVTAVPGPADTLQTPHNTTGRPNQDRQIDGSNVDAELQAGTAHHRPESARFQRELDRPPPRGIEG